MTKVLERKCFIVTQTPTEKMSITINTVKESFELTADVVQTIDTSVS